MNQPRPGRVLIFCPPHLLDSWRNEVSAVFPDADYRVLSSVSDVDAVVSATGFTVCTLSREAAKLGHRLEGVSGQCPKCGTLVTVDAEDLAKKRARCEHQPIFPENEYARLAQRLALQLRLWGPSQYLPSRSRKLKDRWARFGKKYVPGVGAVAVGPKPEPEVDAETEVAVPTYTGMPSDLLHAIREVLIRDSKAHDFAKKALGWALAADPSPDVILDAARRLKPKEHDHGRFAESLLLLLPEGGALGLAFELLQTFPVEKSYYVGAGPPQSATEWFKAQFAKRDGVKPVSEDEDEAPVHRYGDQSVRMAGLKLGKDPESGAITVEGKQLGSIEVAASLLKAIGELSTWSHGPVCGEPLYQSIPEPRRYPLAKYIVKQHRKTFDFVVIDEAHEAASSESAQSIAAFRLTSLKLPTILMTGTIMNGYASSLFAPFQATDREFQEEFARNEEGAFVDRYGYRKRLVQDKQDGKVIAYGSQSDRVEKTERDIGDAPGVLPLFLFSHLLKGAVTLHKADLRIDLPPLTQDRVTASVSGDLIDEFEPMLKALLDQIKHDRFDEEKAGKLFGQLAEIGSYLDRATTDVGNGHGDRYEVRYPESVGGALVTSAPLFPKDVVLPKESLMLDVVQKEVGAGRRAMVFGWHIDLLPRLQRLLQERLGEDVPILYADKVPTAKRQAWIEKQIVAKKKKVMVVNPVCIQTGLNSMTHFATIWQHENPACNPIVDRQSIGRIDRIGQKLETRVFRAFYGGTIQEKMHDLLMNKVAISTATDGLDSTAALMAAGADPGSLLTGLSIGKELWRLMEEGGLSSERPQLRLVRNHK